MPETFPPQQAIQEVRARVCASRTSFHAGMAILPKARREAMYALYAFCREVDDIADDGATLEIRRGGLQQWREKISALFQRGEPTEFITQALLPAIKEYALVEEDFQAIIDGMEMDAGDPVCAPDMKTLDLYCDRVASAVGRASVRIFGENSTNGMKVAYHLGRALQLTNILRDLAEDAARGRLYLPEELLAKHSVIEHNPKEVLNHASLGLVCRDLAEIAQGHFKAADVAMALCSSAAMRPARVMRAYYGAIFNRLLKEGWRNPLLRVALPKWKKLLLVLKALFR